MKKYEKVFFEIHYVQKSDVLLSSGGMPDEFYNENELPLVPLWD